VVVGDVNSTLGCALVAAKSGALLAHVEAGLRSRDWSMPEEVNRAVTDRLSDYLFAPSADAVANLRAEGCRGDQVHFAGNVMVDTLLANRERAAGRPILSELGLAPRGYGLVTLHRPANVDDPAVLKGLLSALARVADLVPLVFPAHPRAERQLREAGLPPGLRVIPPAGYLDFVALEDAAALVLTDSGGVQEETTVLGTPCLTLRESTERPVTVTEGTNRVVGRDPTAWWLPPGRPSPGPGPAAPRQAGTAGRVSGSRRCCWPARSARAIRGLPPCPPAGWPGRPWLAGQASDRCPADRAGAAGCRSGPGGRCRSGPGGRGAGPPGAPPVEEEGRPEHGHDGEQCQPGQHPHP